MAALVQTFPQQTSSATMLQARPTPTSGIISAGQSHGSHNYMGASSQAPRSSYHGASSAPGYRSSPTPVQPYAFTSTPSLNQAVPWQPYGASRTASPLVHNTNQVYDHNTSSHRRPPSSSNSASGLAYSHSSRLGHGISRDDFVLSGSRSTPTTARPLSQVPTGAQTLLGVAGSPSMKNTPDRYRRPSYGSTHHGRSQGSALSGAASVPTDMTYNAQAAARRNSNLALAGPKPMLPGSSMDDLHLHNRPFHNQAARMRRRSMHTIDVPDLAGSNLNLAGDAPRSDSLANGKSAGKDVKTPRVSSALMHSRKGSSDSASSMRSNPSRPSSATNRNPSTAPSSPLLSSSLSDEAAIKLGQQKTATNSAAASPDLAKPTLNPSPLSKQASMTREVSEDDVSSALPGPASGATSGPRLDSPAAKQLTAISHKGGKAKSKTSRLRRAFSFGSTADFRKVAGGQSNGADLGEPLTPNKESMADEGFDAEQARIAEAQEAAGIGNSIYGGHFFGSTDNLSISSTASSASVMIRKMGRGMKKSTRSLIGLFRPKSNTSVSDVDLGVSEVGQASVSMITAEAETRRTELTVDLSPSSCSIGSPLTQQDSMEIVQASETASDHSGSLSTDKATPRKSIAGGDRERAEVLAAVRRGILKRSASSSPSGCTTEGSDELWPPGIRAASDTPSSSAPSTPNEEAQGQGHKRTGSIAIGNEDYFVSELRLGREGKTPPETPRGTAKRNATFSPRLVFYDTWPSQEYDRRGDVATCNRLTPMLAQQIKEELNTFKMEMEVHENSKIYTHFF